MNTSPATLDEGNLDVPLTNPPLKAVQIWFETGIQVTARNMKKGVTIKDALKAIYKLYHKKVRPNRGPAGLCGSPAVRTCG